MMGSALADRFSSPRSQRPGPCRPKANAGSPGRHVFDTCERSPMSRARATRALPRSSCDDSHDRSAVAIESCSARAATEPPSVLGRLGCSRSRVWPSRERAVTEQRHPTRDHLRALDVDDHLYERFDGAAEPSRSVREQDSSPPPIAIQQCDVPAPSLEAATRAW